MFRSNLAFALLLMVCGFMGMPAACSQPKGALILAVTTDMQTPKDVNIISLYVATDSQPKFDYLTRVSPDGTLGLPGTLAIVEPDNPNAQVRIRVIAFQEQRPIVLRDVLTTVPHQRTALLRVPLNFLDSGQVQGQLPAAYLPGNGSASGSDAGGGAGDGQTQWDPTNLADVTPTCDFTQGQTSIAGQCASASIDSKTLPDYTDSQVFGSGEAGACFDVGQCFMGATPVNAVDMQGCTFPLPAGADPQHLNVALVTNNGPGKCIGSNCFVPLENDASEGWTVSGGQVQLVPGVCAKMSGQSTKAQLYVSTGACAPKVEANQVCEPTAPPMMSDGGLPQTCANAALEHAYVGCDFWPTVTANIVSSVFDYAVVVANVAGTQTAHVTVTGPQGTNQMVTVAPGQLTKVYLPWVSALKGPDDISGGGASINASVLARAGAYHLVSDVPVAAYQFNALEYAGMGGPAGKDWSNCNGDAGASMCFSYSNDASLLLPTAAMTKNYRVTGHEGWTTGNLSSYVVITATGNGTTVTMKLSSTAQVLAGGGIAATSAGGTLTLSMNAGDVAELLGQPSDSSDLSGSLITANNPIQVITGMPCVNVPDTASACDHIEETNLPSETLGQDYIVVQPARPETGTGVGQVVRIYGNFDGTTLTYQPSTPSGCPSTINAGQVVECGVVSQDFEVKGSSPFAVSVFTQGGSVVDSTGGQGDPDQSMVPPVAQFRTAYVFLAPTDYQDNWVVVTSPSGATVSLDGQPIGGTSTPVGASGYGVQRVALLAGQAGAHVITASQPIGVQVMGYGQYTSYQYPAGYGLAPIGSAPLK